MNPCPIGNLHFGGVGWGMGRQVMRGDKGAGCISALPSKLVSGIVVLISTAWPILALSVLSVMSYYS